MTHVRASSFAATHPQHSPDCGVGGCEREVDHIGSHTLTLPEAKRLLGQASDSIDRLGWELDDAKLRILELEAEP